MLNVPDQIWLTSKYVVKMWLSSIQVTSKCGVTSEEQNKSRTRVKHNGLTSVRMGGHN